MEAVPEGPVAGPRVVRDRELRMEAGAARAGGKGDLEGGGTCDRVRRELLADAADRAAALGQRRDRRRRRAAARRGLVAGRPRERAEGLTSRAELVDSLLDEKLADEDVRRLFGELVDRLTRAKLNVDSPSQAAQLARLSYAKGRIFYEKWTAWPADQRRTQQPVVRGTVVFGWHTERELESMNQEVQPAARS